MLMEVTSTNHGFPIIVEQENTKPSTVATMWIPRV